MLNNKVDKKEPTDFGKQSQNFQDVNKQKQTTQFGSHDKDHK